MSTNFRGKVLPGVQLWQSRSPLQEVAAFLRSDELDEVKAVKVTPHLVYVWKKVPGKAPYIARIRPSRLKDPKHAPYLIDPPDKKDAVADIGDPHKFGGSIDHLKPVGGADEVPITSKDEPPEPEDEGEVWEHPSYMMAQKHRSWLALKPMQYIDSTTGQTKTAHGIDLKKHYLDPRTGFLYDRSSGTLVGWYDSMGKLKEGEPPHNLENAMRRAWKPMGAGWAGRRAVEMGLKPGQMRHPLNNKVMTPELPDDPGAWLDPESGLVYKDEQLLGWVDHEGDYIEVTYEAPDRHQLAAMIKKKAGKFLKKLTEPKKAAEPEEPKAQEPEPAKQEPEPEKPELSTSDEKNLQFSVDALNWLALDKLATDPVMGKYFVQPAADKFNKLVNDQNHAAASKIAQLIVTNLKAQGKPETADKWQYLVDKQTQYAKEKEAQAQEDPPTPAEQPVSILDKDAVQGLIAQGKFTDLIDRAAQLGLLYKSGKTPWLSMGVPLNGVLQIGTEALQKGDFVTAMHMSSVCLVAAKAAGIESSIKMWAGKLDKYAEKFVATKSVPQWGEDSVGTAVATKDYDALIHAAGSGSIPMAQLEYLKKVYSATVSAPDGYEAEQVAQALSAGYGFYDHEAEAKKWKDQAEDWHDSVSTLGSVKDAMDEDDLGNFAHLFDTYPHALVSPYGQKVMRQGVADALQAGKFDKAIGIAKGMSDLLSKHSLEDASEMFSEAAKNAESLKKSQEEEKAGKVIEQSPYFGSEYLQKSLDTGAWTYLLTHYSEISPASIDTIEAAYNDLLATGDFAGASQAAQLLGSVNMNAGLHDMSDMWLNMKPGLKKLADKYEKMQVEPPSKDELNVLLADAVKHSHWGDIVNLMSVPGFKAGPAFLPGGSLHPVYQSAIAALPSASGAEWDALKIFAPILIKKAQLEGDVALEAAWTDLYKQAKEKVKKGGHGIAAPPPSEAKPKLDPDSIFVQIQQRNFDLLDTLPATSFQYIHRHALTGLYNDDLLLAKQPGNESMQAHLHGQLARIATLMEKAVSTQSAILAETWKERAQEHLDKAKAAQEVLNAALAKKQPEEIPAPIAADKIDHVLAQNNSNETAIWSSSDEDTWPPEGAVLNGVAFASAPDKFWEKHVDLDFGEPELKVKGGNQRASGVLVVEPDGRMWIVEPEGHYGGYKHTFPKGKKENHLSLQQNALKEAYEESGLQVEIVGHLGDFEGETSHTRYYIARRVGGKPWEHHWETSKVKLVPPDKAEQMLNVQRDKDVLKALQEKLKDPTLQQKLVQKNLPEDAEEKTTGTGIPKLTVPKIEDVASSIVQFHWIPKPPKSKPTKKACKASSQALGVAPNEFIHPVTKEVFAVVGLGKWEYVHPSTGTVYGKGGEVITDKIVVATGKSVEGTAGEALAILMAPKGPTPSFPTPTVLPKPVPAAEPIDEKSLQVKALKSIAMPVGMPALTSLTLKGGAKHLGGAGEKSIYEDAQGNKWLHKVASEKSGGAPKPYAVAVQVVWSQVAKKVLGDHLPVGPAELGGKIGTLQPLLALDDAQPDLAHVSPHKLSDADRAGLMKEHALDWLMSQHDSHGANFIRRAEDGKLFSVDKEQGFKYFGTDKLDIDYKPNTVLYGENEPYHNKLWRGWLEGKYELPLDELEGTLQKIMAIPTPEYIKMLRPYAEVKWPGKLDEQREFLRAARRRKLDVVKDFEGFLTMLHRKRHGTDGNFTFAEGWSGAVQNPKGPKVKKVTYDAIDYVKKMAEETGASIKVDTHHYMDKDKVDLVDEFCVKFPNSMHPSPQEYAKQLFDKLGLVLPEPILGSTQVKYVVPKLAMHSSKIEVEELVNPPVTTHGVKPHPAHPRYHADDYTYPVAKDNFHELAELHNAQFNGRPRRIDIDGPNVVGSDMRIHRYKDSNGTYFKVQFKFTPPMLKEVWDHGGGTSSTYKYQQADYNADHDAYQPSGTTLHDPDTRKWTIGKSEIHVANQWNHSGENSYYGHVFAHIRPKAGETIEGALRNLLDQMKPGLADSVLQPPTEEGKETWKLMQTLWAHAPQVADKLAWKDRNPERIRKELAKVGIDDKHMESVVLEEVLPGFKTHVEKGRWSRLHKNGARFLFHGVNTSHINSIVRLGCLGIDERDQHGVEKTGVSSTMSGDINSGSANGVLGYFVTQKALDEGTHLSSHSFAKSLQVVIHPKEAERLDAYWHGGGDKYGTCTPFANNHQSGSVWTDRLTLEDRATALNTSYSHSHEISFRRGINPKAILRIVSPSEHTRAEAIQKLKSEGVHEVNGVPVEDFVVVETDCKKVYEKYVKPVLELEEA